MSNSPATWRDAWSIYTQRSVFSMIILGFTAGLPFLLVFSTLSAWLRDEGIERTVIGFFSWVGVTYSIKVFWAPVIDHLKLPLLHRLLGKRRSWMLLAQIGIIVGLVFMGSCDTASQLEWIAMAAVWVAFCSATQDVVIDAYRIESAVPEYQGAMAAMYVLGYRIALLVAGAGAFLLAEFFNWSYAYWCMAVAMALGLFAAVWLTEAKPEFEQKAAKEAARQALWPRIRYWFVSAVIAPFVDFFKRNGRSGILILMLIGCYKMSDITMGVMANPFYLDLGFSKQEIAEVTKIFGFFMTIAGASVGGLLVLRYGIRSSLLLGAIMVASTNLLFAALAKMEPNLWLLAGVVSADNLSGGLASSVFIAYLSSLTSREYTATQYALFSSLMTLPAQLLGGFSGMIVDKFGYQVFFVYASLLGVPAILLVLWLLRKYRSSSQEV